jgi:hypothetical protein
MPKQSRPNAPFRLGSHKVTRHDGRQLSPGPSATITVVRSACDWIKYRRKCPRMDPKGRRTRHARVMHAGNWYRVALGRNEYVRVHVPVISACRTLST